WCRGGKIAADGPPVHAHLAGNTRDAMPGGAPITHLVPACASPRLSDEQVLLCLAGRWQRRRRSRTRLLGRLAEDHRFDAASTAAQYLIQCCASVRVG